VGSEDPGLSFFDHLPLTQAAVGFARERHIGQRRPADGASFMLHPLEVAAMLERSGYADQVVAAAVLHDVLEDTAAERADLDARFGAEVGALVATVSDDPSIEGEEERKEEVRDRVRRAGGDAAVIYAADKVSKTRELRILLVRKESSEQARVKLRRYWASLQMLEQTIPDDRLVALLRFELEALEQLPPEGGSG
jgi:(p)ppGpp synthase/HD superfamily hydrolase